MAREKDFKRKDGNTSARCLQYYNQVKNYAEKNNFESTLKALELAIALHNGQFRDGGEPYIIHPFSVTIYLIFLNLQHYCFHFHMASLHNEKSALKKVFEDMDILLSASLLHDVVEECKSKFPEYREEIHRISSKVWKFVNILTKDKDNPEYSDEQYFKDILKYWQTTLIKNGDRVDNCSTISVYKKERKKKYVQEVHDYFYSLNRLGKIYFPDFAKPLEITENFLISISETVASVYGMSGIIHEEDLSSTLSYIKGYADGHAMQNTYKAIACAEEIYVGLTRKSGDPFIIHPLHVCRYLISLGIDDDEICASALVHEAIKKCCLRDDAIELITKWKLSTNVRDMVAMMASNRNYTLQLYYNLLKENPKVFLLKMANKVNTCTYLKDLPISEIRKYIYECEKFTFPTCEYMIGNYTDYAYSINLMKFHIESECRLVQNLFQAELKKDS